MNIQLKNQTYVSQNNESVTTKNKKPKIIEIVSILIFFIAIKYFFISIGTLEVIFIMNQSIGAENFVFSFLKYFPSWGLLPIMFSMIMLLFVYVSLKVINGSKFGLWIGVGSLLVIPLYSTLIGLTLRAPVIDLFQNSKIRIGKELLKTSLINIGDVTLFILTGVSLVLLILAHKKFHFPHEPLTLKAKILLAILALYIVLPIFTLVIFEYKKSKNKDFGYNNVKSQVNYRSYRPSPKSS